jgi:hypothetical protein
LQGSLQGLGDQAGLAGPIAVVEQEGGQVDGGVGQPGLGVGAGPRDLGGGDVVA